MILKKMLVMLVNINSICSNHVHTCAFILLDEKNLTSINISIRF